MRKMEAAECFKNVNRRVASTQHRCRLPARHKRRPWRGVAIDPAVHRHDQRLRH